MGEDGRSRSAHRRRSLIVEKPAYDWAAEKKHWAYQPVREHQPPAVSDPEWSRTLSIASSRAKLDEKATRSRSGARTSGHCCDASRMI